MTMGFRSEQRFFSGIDSSRVGIKHKTSGDRCRTVVDRPDPNCNVYVIDPLEGNGPSRTVNRSDLLDSRELVDATPPVNHVQKGLSLSGPTDANDSDSQDDFWILPVETSPQMPDPGNEVNPIPNTEHPRRRTSDRAGEQSSDSSDESSSSKNETAAMRRSQRSTKGKHSNPHRLPRANPN